MAKYTLDELYAVVENELATPDGERFTVLRFTKFLLEALIDERELPQQDTRSTTKAKKRALKNASAPSKLLGDNV